MYDDRCENIVEIRLVVIDAKKRSRFGKMIGNFGWGF